jgi:uncharacterized protein YjbJ (UPF0337 family)
MAAPRFRRHHSTRIEVACDVLIGRLQERYGIARDEIERQVRAWGRGFERAL